MRGKRCMILIRIHLQGFVGPQATLLLTFHTCPLVSLKLSFGANRSFLAAGSRDRSHMLLPALIIRCVSNSSTLRLSPSFSPGPPLTLALAPPTAARPLGARALRRQLDAPLREQPRPCGSPRRRAGVPLARKVHLRKRRRRKRRRPVSQAKPPVPPTTPHLPLPGAIERPIARVAAVLAPHSHGVCIGNGATSRSRSVSRGR